MTAGRLDHRRTLVLAALVAAIGAAVLTAFLVHQAGPSPARAITAFAGRRDDPFFFNLTGFLNILDIGGQSFVGCGGPNSHPETDTFKGQNVSSIVLELPSKLIEGGGDSKIGVWATTNVGK